MTASGWFRVLQLALSSFETRVPRMFGVSDFECVLEPCRRLGFQVRQYTLEVILISRPRCLRFVQELDFRR